LLAVSHHQPSSQTNKTHTDRERLEIRRMLEMMMMMVKMMRQKNKINRRFQISEEPTNKF
jgi:hypothetical protein